jgi:tRNA pseudouridine55 synthase
VVDKPAGLTSHDAVARARRQLGTKRIGHSGTLDPDATGVLLLGIGRATRLLRFSADLPKSYSGELVLGVETNTLDAAGEVTATHDMRGVALDHVRAAATAFVGDLEQVPPMVSAIQIGGKRLHELARQGIEVERAPRPVTVHRLSIEPGSDDGVFRIDVDCSSGTYIRSLAADIGRALGGGAHLRGLRRTAIGPHTAAVASPLDTIVVQPAAAAVAHLPAVIIDEKGREAIAVGRLPEGAADGEGPWALLSTAGELLAVAEAVDGTPKLGVVLAAR